MRSLAFKLTLAFLATGLIIAGLVAFFVGRQTQREFDQFVLDRYQLDLVERLATHYETAGDWSGAGSALTMGQPPPGGGRPNWTLITLADADGVIILGEGERQPGQRVSDAALAAAAPIRVNEEIVGYILPPPPPDNAPNSPEAAFVAAVRRAILYGLAGGAVAAFLLGVLLARAISQPVQALTQATHRIAEGDLSYEVPVCSRDEIGELAVSFNRMTAKLAEANQLRRQMTADIAHDLRTPTSVIMGFAEALSDGALDGSPEIYQVLHQEAQRLAHLIEDLRTLSLADAGELPLLKRPTNPLELLERTAAAHSIQAHQQGVNLRLVEPSGPLPPILVDPERMAQVLSNLVVNALRYTPAGGEISLEAAQEGSKLCLLVCDNGAGIRPEDLPHIFRRFYRSDKSRPSDGESGLGLAIVRSIVAAHGGQVSAASVLGEGTAFTITLVV